MTTKQLKETIAGQEIEYSLTFVRNPLKQESKEWHETSHKWLFSIKGMEFDYYTGLGHREYDKKRAIWNHRLTSTEWAKLTYGKLTPTGFTKLLECSKPKEPDLKGFLWSLMMDGSACETSFADWCDELGYSTDSRTALQTYEACQINGDKLRKLGLDMSKLREELEDY